MKKLIWKKILFWVIAVVITLAASVYQRMTGPTHPAKVLTTIAGEEIFTMLPRSGNEEDKVVIFRGIPEGVDGTLYWKKYPSADGFTAQDMIREGGSLKGFLPVQPPAGKLEYYIVFDEPGGKTTELFTDAPLVIRFKGDVPAWVLIPHILLMFAAMLLAVYAALAAIGNIPTYGRYVKLTFWTLLAGGLIFGPILQYYAFGEFWTGFPLGMDLTDNKTLIAFIGFLIAVLTLRKKWNRWAVVGATALMLVVFSIPHSVMGSELDHETGKIQQADL